MAVLTTRKQKTSTPKSVDISRSSIILISYTSESSADKFIYGYIQDDDQHTQINLNPTNRCSFKPKTKRRPVFLKSLFGGKKTPPPFTFFNNF